VHDGGSLSYTTNTGGTVTHYLRGTPYIGVGEPSTHEVRTYRSGRQLVIEGLPHGAHAEWTDADGRVRWATDRAEGFEELRTPGHGTGILRWTLDGQRGVLKFVY
jgi:hypothetical protein